MTITTKQVLKALEGHTTSTPGPDNSGILLPTDEGVEKLIALLKTDNTLFDSYHPKLEAFFTTNFPGEKLPWGLTSWQFLYVNLLVTIAPVALSPHHLHTLCADFFIAAGYKDKVTRDPIQHVNKTGQIGLQHLTVWHEGVLYYHLNSLTVSNHRRVEPVLNGDKEDMLAASIEHLEKRLKSRKAALAKGDIHVGHRNPHGSDPSANNLIAQSGTENRAYRDRYIFDEYGDIAAPAPDFLVKNSSKYYDNSALNDIFKGLLLNGNLKISDDLLTVIKQKTKSEPDDTV